MEGANSLLSDRLIAWIQRRGAEVCVAVIVSTSHPFPEMGDEGQERLH